MNNSYENNNPIIPENDHHNASEQPAGEVNNSNPVNEQTERQYINHQYYEAPVNSSFARQPSDRVPQNYQDYNGFCKQNQEIPYDNFARYNQQGRPYNYGNPNYGYNERQQFNPQNRFEGNSGYGEYRNFQNAPIDNGVKKKEKRAASKGFVAVSVAIGMIFCLFFGALSSSYYYRLMQKNQNKGLNSVPSVNIQYESSEERPEITDKGTPAYVASKALQTVVEVRTETVSTDTYYGQYVKEGAGSGVIISSGEAGTYIITCAHVIDGATKVFVTTNDGNEYEASFTAADSLTDIGIIKIDVKGLGVAHADFTDVVIGEEVVAIGNPLGELGGSVTNGIVSALDRDIIIDGTTYHLLQTNAEINPGNSGGGLFDMNGNLIGIVNAKSAGENVEGLGFAIPIDDAMEIATELIKNGYVTGRVQLGFTLLNVDSNEVVYKYWQYSKYFTDFGIYILESQSPDFRVGDRLLAIDSKTVSTIPEIKNKLLDFEVGDKVTITISRLNSNNQSEILNIDLVLTEMTNKKS